MNAAFAGVLSVFFVFAGGLCGYEYTFYTREQKAAAPGLSSAYLGASVLITLVGLAGPVSIAIGPDLEWTFASIAAILAALPAVVQHRLHRKLGIERSPLTEYAAENWR